MNLEPAPRLPKWIFLAIDGGLLLAAFIIVYFAHHPYDPVPLVSTVALIGLAAIIGLVPFLIEYAADSAEYVQEERERVGEQVQRLHAAGESLARAAAQIKAVEEAVHKTAHAAENLPYRMQEKLAEFNAALAEKEEGDREALEQELAELRAANSEQLKAVADKIHKAATDWAALEAATRKQLAAAEAAVARVQAAAGDAAGRFEARLAAALASVGDNPGAPSAGKPPSPSVEPAPAIEARAAPVSVFESVAVVETTAASDAVSPATVEETKPKKPRAPRKPRDISPEPATEPVESAAESPPSSLSADEAVAPAEAAASSDGATRLLATAYIGIGNKLFIRGSGPGLSWDKGVPMQFVSIGKWGWATQDATAPVRCKLYKNDEIAAMSGEVVLEPGKHVEVTALF